MDVLNEIMEMKDTIAKKIAEANQRIRKSDGDLNNGDVEYIDKLTHSMKSLATICAMLEAEEGYSGNWDPYYYGNDRGYSGRERRAGYSREGSGNDGGYSREGREGRYSREGRARRYSGNGYSRNGEVTEHLRMLMDEAPDESTRMEIKRLMDKFDQR